MTNVRDIQKSVRIVSQPWESSAYYEHAEKFTWRWWSDSTRPFRRMFDRLDPSHTLELACGYGRHSEIVASLTSDLVLMDVLPQNIEFCRTRLATQKGVTFHVNNGFDFQPVGSDSITALFCYDAMVHFSPDIVQSYLRDANRILKSGGMALLHHSNYDGPVSEHYGLHPHARNYMPRAMFQKFALDAGLVILESETFAWGDVKDLDCLTLLQKPAAQSG